MAQILDRVALFFVVDERTVEVCIQKNVAQVVFAHQFGIFVTAEGLNLPAGRAIIGLYRGHSLKREILANQIRS